MNFIDEEKLLISPDFIFEKARAFLLQGRIIQMVLHQS